MDNPAEIRDKLEAINRRRIERREAKRETNRKALEAAGVLDFLGHLHDGFGEVRLERVVFREPPYYLGPEEDKPSWRRYWKRVFGT